MDACTQQRVLRLRNEIASLQSENRLYRSQRHHTREEKRSDDLRRLRLLAIREELGTLLQQKSKPSLICRKIAITLKMALCCTKRVMAWLRQFGKWGVCTFLQIDSPSTGAHNTLRGWRGPPHLPTETSRMLHDGLVAHFWRGSKCHFVSRLSESPCSPLPS